MADASQISDETLEVLRDIPTQTLIDGLWVKGWPMSYVEGARPLQLGQKMAGRAVTLRFVPHRPDLVQDKPKGVESAEYVAIELCGPGEVLVIDAMGWKYSSIGGDIKFFRMMQLRAGGLVTDGAVKNNRPPGQASKALQNAFCYPVRWFDNPSLSSRTGPPQA